MKNKSTVALVLSLLLFGNLNAAVLIVGNTNDAGVGSLRDQVAAANPGDTISFSPDLNNLTITLISGSITIDKNLTIVGPGYNQLTIDGNTNGRIFMISNASVSMYGLKMINGYQNQSLENHGGAIYHKDGGNLTLNNIYFDNDRALNGNGSEGGAVAYFIGGGTFMADTCFFMNCSADGFGGALCLNGYPAYAKLNACTFDRDSARVKGIVFTSALSLDVTNSTFSNNTAEQNAIMEIGANTGTYTFTNCTFSNNIASNPSAGIDSRINLTMVNCTYTGNNEPIYLMGMHSQPVLTIQNSIFNGMTTGYIDGMMYNVVSNGGNICSDNSMDSYLTASNDLSNTDPGLDVLADNGGVTKTHALLENSLAIDNGIGLGAPAFDQTGTIRTGAPDAGTMEFNLATHVSKNGLKNPDMVAYPNPTSGLINFSGIEKNSTFELYDIFGRKVLQTLTNGSVTTINMSLLSRGLYQYRITGNKTISGTIIRN